jgi:hypothetical protein
MRCGSQIRSGVLFGIGRKSPYFSHEMTLATDYNWHCKHEHIKLEYAIRGINKNRMKSINTIKNTFKAYLSL